MSSLTLKKAINAIIKLGIGAGLTFTSSIGLAAYDIENIDRGVVAIQHNNGNFISWRWLGYEPDSTGFNIYRDGIKLNTNPITDRTNFIDSNGNSNSRYTITTVINGQEGEASAATSPWSDIYKKIPLNKPNGGTTPDGVNYTYTPNDASVADLDGDGQYEIILKWDPTNSKDNSQSGYTGNVYIDAYEMDGTLMWRIDLGRNIRAGAHYTQFIAYDLDSDGKAEIAMRTSDATKDGTGAIIGNANADYRASNGYILSGPEFLTIFEGSTGKALASTDYVPARGSVSSWGDSYGNRVDRFLAGLAWLDGEKPSLIMARGYYTRAVIAAWDWRNGQLTKRWVFDSNDSGNSSYAKQGAHSLSVADVDDDGKHEIIYGAATIDDNGTGLYSTGLGHGDALHVSDIDPNRPGLEVFMVHETPSQYGEHGVEVHDAKTGKILWSASGEDTDIGRGLAMDIDPRYPGYEAWGSRGGLRTAEGELISTTRPSQINFGVYWDGDLLREILDDTKIDKWQYSSLSTSRLLTAYNYGAASNNGTKKTPALSGDILGDWREEVIWRSDSNDALLIFSSTIESQHRFRTLMHNPQYRSAIAWQNVGYNQPPHLSYFLGDGMSSPVQPDINPIGTTTITPTATLNSWIDNEQVSLSWKVTGQPSGTLELYRDSSESELGKTLIATYGSTETSGSDMNVTPGKTYYYQLKTTSSGGEEVSSNAIPIKIPSSNESTLLLEENATGFCGVDGVVETTHVGYTGVGYSNTENNNGTSIEYRIYANSAGLYNLSTVFANGSATARPAIFVINGTETDEIPLESTIDWTNWQQSPLKTVTLSAGLNTIEFKAINASGLPNIDSLKVHGNGITAANCNGTVPSPTPDLTPTPTPTPTATPTPTPTPTPEITPTGTGTSSSSSSSSGGTTSLSCDIAGFYNWGSGYQVEVVVTNNDTANNSTWEVELSFNQTPNITNSWGSTLSVSGNTVIASGASWNSTLAPEDTATFGFLGSSGSNIVKPTCSVR